VKHAACPISTKGGRAGGECSADRARGARLTRGARAQGEVQDAMQQYAATGRVTSGPAAPGGLARTDPKHKEAFDSMFRKGPGAGASAPEKPTFALGCRPPPAPRPPRWAASLFGESCRLDAAADARARSAQLRRQG